MVTKAESPTVLHVAPTPFFSDRGCHIRIEGVANCLEQLGYDNLVCTYHHGRDIDGVRTSRISTIKNYTKTEAGPSKHKIWADWKLLCLVVKEIRRTKPAVVHAHLHEGLMIGLIAKLVLFWMRIPLVADMQGSLVGELETHGSFRKLPWLRWPTRLIEASLMLFARTIVCSSAHSLEKIKEEFSLSDEKISLVQDGAREVEFLGPEEQTRLRTELGLPDQKRIVVYSGALLDSKGLNELKKLISLAKQEEKVHFLIIGYPVDDLNAFLSDQGVAELCTLTGQVEFEKLPQLLQLADIAVDPKFADAGEGSGKMLNYLACGLPVLAFNSQNNREFLPSSAPLSETVDAMAAQISVWLDNEAELEKAGAENLEHFKAHFSWQQTQQQLATVYKSY